MTKGKVPKTFAEDTFEWIQKQKTFPSKRRGKQARGDLDKRSLDYQMINEAEKQRRRNRYSTIRDTAKKEINDLKRLAKILPEDQQQQIFDENNLWSTYNSDKKVYEPGLFKVLFRFSEVDGVHVGTWEEGKDEDKVIKGSINKISYSPDALKRRQRILRLFRGIIEVLDDPLLSEVLAPMFHDVTLREGGALQHLRAIYYASLRQAQEESPKHASDPKSA